MYSCFCDFMETPICWSPASMHISTGWTPRLSAYRSLTVNGRRRKTSALPSFSSRRTFLMLKVGMPGLPCLSTVKMVTGLTSFLFCSVFKKRLTPSAASDNTWGVLSFTCGSCPARGGSTTPMLSGSFISAAHFP